MGGHSAGGHLESFSGAMLVSTSPATARGQSFTGNFI